MPYPLSRCLHTSCQCLSLTKASQMALLVENLPATAGEVRDAVLIPGSGRPPGGGHGNPLQYFCLENPMEKRACLATVHEVAKSQTQLKWLSTAHSSRSPGNTVLRLEVSVLQLKVGQGTAGNGSVSCRGLVGKKLAWVLRFSNISFSTIGLFFIPNGERSIKKWKYDLVDSPFTHSDFL